MQIKFEAVELKKAKAYVQKLIEREKEIEGEKKKQSSFLKELFKFLFK